MGRVNEIRELTRVRVRTFLREPEAVFWVFIFPIVLAAVLGFAFRTGAAKPSVVAVVPDAALEALVERLEADELVEIQTYEDREEALAVVFKAKADGLVEAGEDGGAPQLSFDPVRPDSAAAELRVRRALDALAMQAAGLEPPPLDTTELTETGSRYVDFLFPGLLGMNLMGTGMWGIGFALADQRRRKFLKRLMVTPMRRSSFLLGFVFSRLVFLVLELVVLVGFAHWVLGVPFKGDVVSFALATLVGAACFSGLGILVASRARTIEGVSGLMNFVMMPMWLASGVFFSYERFPEVIHPVLRLLPLTALNDLLRGIMLDGEMLTARLPELAVLAVWAVITFVVALRIFRWE